METKTCRLAWQHMHDISQQGSVRNYIQILDMRDYLVETDLFPKDVLDAYSCWNLEKDVTEDQKQYFSDLRGGGQGDYREGMRQKIANVVDCLTNYPQSKRAVITMSNQPMPQHSCDDDAKCLREIHLYFDDNNNLSGTTIFRSQAAMIFPKNIHFIGSLMTEIAGQLPQKPELGTLFYLATILVSDRA